MTRSLKCARVIAGALLSGIILAGCATRPVIEADPGLPARVELTEVPFHPQERYQCGPAALATVFNSRGVAVTPEALVPEVYLPAREGSLQAEMIASTRRHGLLPVALEGGMNALLRELAAGNPVLVLQNLGLGWYPRWHYAVAVGYDRDAETVLLRSGTQARRETGFGVFERTWARSRHWALVVVPPDRVPVTASALGYLEAAAGFEAVGSTTLAEQAYTTATRHWPEEPLAWLGLGNARFALGETSAAEAAYREALARDPRRVFAWNNLAYTLQRLGCPAEAREAAACAHRLAPDDPSVSDTWRELQDLKGEPGHCGLPACPVTP